MNPWVCARDPEHGFSYEDQPPSKCGQCGSPYVRESQLATGRSAPFRPSATLARSLVQLGPDGPVAEPIAGFRWPVAVVARQATQRAAAADRSKALYELARFLRRDQPPCSTFELETIENWGLPLEFKFGWHPKRAATFRRLAAKI
jgi:hypothetical protein